MRSRVLNVAVVVGSLALSGKLLGLVTAPTWQAMRAQEPAWQLSSAVAAGGQGVVMALLGGFRALVADATWLRMFLHWEEHDLPTTDTLVHLVPAIDPRPTYFWLNGARILAYDLSAWRMAARGGYDAVPAAERNRINREQAEAAVGFLEQAMRFHPTAVDLWIEKANIELNRFGDVTAAAESYRHAWEMPGGPYYAARLYGQLLRRLGRKAEALAWLKQLYPKLPPNDEAAAADVVLARIRELERELGVPAQDVYHPPG